MIQPSVDFSRRKTLYAHKPLRSAEADLARELVKTHRLDQHLVDTVVSDLTAFPTNWLQRFKQEQVGVAVLKQDQTLADVPLWPEFTAAECDAMLPQCRPVIDEALKTYLGDAAQQASPEARAYYLKMAAPEIKEQLEKLSNEKGLGFAVEPRTSAVDWANLAHTHGIDPQGERYDHWKCSLEQLNQGVCSFSPDGVQPETGIVLIPYVGHQGRHFRAITLPSLKSVRGDQLRQHDGANYPENRFFVVTDQVVPDPSPMSGHHRVVLHEAGHMVDWIARDLPDLLPGHQETVTKLYRDSIKAGQSAPPGTGPILTDRAKDSPGEFFADSVEAYLTMPNDTDFHKADNHRQALKERNPDMFAYLDKVFAV